MMNSHFYFNNDHLNNMNSCCMGNENEKTTFKSKEWTPQKNNNGNETFIGNNENDSTLMMSQPTNTKFFSRMSIGTPQKSKKTINEAYDASIRTPIKKSKRRECTPMYSDDEEVPRQNFGNMNYDNCNSYYASNSYNAYNGALNYNLLRINNNCNPLQKKFPMEFQQLSKSKFLEKIDVETFNVTQEVTESSEIMNKIKGAYLLTLIESDSSGDFNLCKEVYSSLTEDSDLFNKITNLICYCLFEGFNSRSDMFFKFLSPTVYLEIVDQPLNSFQNNLSLLNNYVLKLDPDYSNSQVDSLPEDCKYIFSLQGSSVLNTSNRDQLKFIMSIRIHINLENESKIRSDLVRVEDIITVDFMKIKIFS